VTVWPSDELGDLDDPGDRRTFAREVYEKVRPTRGYFHALDIVADQLREYGYTVPSVRTLERWVKAPAPELNRDYVRFRYREFRGRGVLVKAAVSMLAERFKVSASTIKRAVRE